MGTLQAGLKLDHRKATEKTNSWIPTEIIWINKKIMELVELGVFI